MTLNDSEWLELRYSIAICLWVIISYLLQSMFMREVEFRIVIRRIFGSMMNATSSKR